VVSRDDADPVNRYGPRVIAALAGYLVPIPSVASGANVEA
jgi:hypothetical protein